jgi:hypothetical protein
MAEPKFKVLDLVRVSDEPGALGAITQVREYPGGRLRYCVRLLQTETDDIMATRARILPRRRTIRR